MFEQDKIRRIYKDTEFFMPGKYQPFDKDINNQRIKLRPENVTDITIRCYGYGYFEEGNKKVQSQIKENLISYIRAATRECLNLKVFKLDFNGFSVTDKCVQKIIEVVEDLTRDKIQKEAIWIHTRFLRDCETTTVQDMLGLIDVLAKSNFEQISVMMSGWEFKDSPMSYQKLEEIFGTFGKNLTTMPKSPLKRVKLDISSWYMQNLEAYNLLSKALTYKFVAERIQKARQDERSQDKKKSNASDRNLQQNLDKIIKYLNNLDRKYAIENPLPSKGPRFINPQKEFEKKKLQYIRQLMDKRLLGQNISSEDLEKIYKNEWGMPREHKQKLKEIEKDIQEEYEKQEKRIKQEQALIEETNELQKEITKEFIKFPFDYIMAERVRAFHKLIIAFVADVNTNLETLQEFELDMRNWNGLFQMADLKKMLDKQFAQIGALKLIGSAFNAFSALVNKAAIKEEEQEGPKLKLSFIM